MQKYYSEEFKLEVVRQVQQGKLTKESARRYYGIAGKSSVLRWIRNYENYGICSIALTHKTMASKKPQASKENKSAPASTVEHRLLEQRISQLERQLEDAHLLGEMYDRMITIAEREYKIPIRKKPDTR